MERGFRQYPDFERSAESRREFYSQVETYLLEEFERDPGLKRELKRFLGYVQWMQRAVPFVYPFQEREARVEYLHHAIDVLAMPALPVAPLPPNRRIAVGEHMIVSTGYAASACWPDRRKKTLTLSDNTSVEPRTSLGKIDIVRNLPQLTEEKGAVFAFARHLLKSTTGSLIDLAQLSEHLDSRVSGVSVYGGVSHLARIAGKLHFTVFPIQDERSRRVATDISKGVARHVVGGVTAWKEMEANYKPAEVAFISKDSLIEHFGTRAVSQGFSRP